MRILVQRVSHATVHINGEKKSSIGRGLLLFLGIEEEDDYKDIAYLCRKVVQLRIFD
ncbi:MAG: D-aminoacyl-tRNA deacylase, partial [Proteiniphilum sp.]|nr:D-aminoacyl-tRNA deacylase [Proteiniphilum sp.]